MAISAKRHALEGEFGSDSFYDDLIICIVENYVLVESNRCQ